MEFQFRKILYTSSKLFPQNHFKITFFQTAENSINGFKVFSFKIRTGVYETLFTLHPPSDLKCLWFELEIDGSLDAFAELSKGAAGVNFLFVSVPMCQEKHVFRKYTYSLSAGNRCFHFLYLLKVWGGLNYRNE